MIEGVEVKLSGLVSSCILRLATQEPSTFSGVTLEEGLLSEVTLSRDNVAEVASYMRHYLLTDWASECNYCNRAYGDSRPLSNLQDILHFASDVEAFERIAIWLADLQRQDEDVISFG
jgi:hypothetical protein